MASVGVERMVERKTTRSGGGKERGSDQGLYTTTTGLTAAFYVGLASKKLPHTSKTVTVTGGLRGLLRKRGGVATEPVRPVSDDALDRTGCSQWMAKNGSTGHWGSRGQPLPQTVLG